MYGRYDSRLGEWIGVRYLGRCKASWYDLRVWKQKMIYLFFFFSSRRRHTRYWRDWSSDVCSSDLAESQAAIWEGIRSGVFQTFSSDHCPFRYDDPQGKLTPKGRTSFRWVPNGIPGVAARLPILFSEGVGKGRIDLNRFVALTSTNHAKTYGLYPRKGTIAIGSDADIVIWDPERTLAITHDLLKDGS